jgi:hypothetical protein
MACPINGSILFTTRQVVTESCRIFEDCVFLNISNPNSDGGAICFETSNSQMNEVIDCTFFGICSGRGGGIWTSTCLNVTKCCARCCWTESNSNGQFLYADSSESVIVVNPTLFECHSGSDPPFEVQGTIFLSSSTRMNFSELNITSSRNQVDAQPATGASDGVIFFVDGTANFADRCSFGTFFGNVGRSGAYGSQRTNLSYFFCNFVNNSIRYSILYQNTPGLSTIELCIFMGNKNMNGDPSAIGPGICRLIRCVFDGPAGNLKDATITFSTEVIFNTRTATHTLWHLNTALCPGFRSPTQPFTVSSDFIGTSSFSLSSSLSASLSFWHSDVLTASSCYRSSIFPFFSISFDRSADLLPSVSFDGSANLRSSVSFHLPSDLLPSVSFGASANLRPSVFFRRSVDLWPSVSFGGSPELDSSVSFGGSADLWSSTSFHGSSDLWSSSEFAPSATPAISTGLTGSDRSSPVVVIVVSVGAFLIVVIIAVIIWLRIRRKNLRNGDDRMGLSSDVGDVPPTLEFCYSETNDTLTLTETDPLSPLMTSLV